MTNRILLYVSHVSHSFASYRGPTLLQIFAIMNNAIANILLNSLDMLTIGV